MAQYKVPQDVEADDKLIGPFSFRQFVYLMIAAGLCFVAWLLLSVFAPLVIIPLPLIILFIVLALPLKKDQPMETYLAALINFYLNPRKRIWRPGQPESTIEITAPKTVEKSLTKDITGSEATHRLSFLADLVDSGGQILSPANSVKAEFVEEANAIQDIFDPMTHNIDFSRVIDTESEQRRNATIAKMRAAIENTEQPYLADTSLRKFASPATTTQPPPTNPTPHQVVPDIGSAQNSLSDGLAGQSAQAVRSEAERTPASVPSESPILADSQPQAPDPKLANLAAADDLSISTIAKEANRIKKQDDEVFISLRGDK